MAREEIVETRRISLRQAVSGAYEGSGEKFNSVERW
jgi:hypothetical protein